MTGERPRAGVAFVVDERGLLVEVLYDSLGLFSPAAHGEPVAGLLEAGSVGKWFALLDAMRKRGAVHDWQVEAQLGDAVITLEMAAARRGERVIVAATEAPGDLAQLIQGLPEVGNGDFELLRQVFKRSPAPPREGMAWESFTELHSEMASMQRELAKQNAELERVNRQRNELLGMVAHDLRTPLQAIAMACYALKQGGHALDPRTERLLSTIRHSVDFMGGVVSDVLDLSAIESGAVELEVEAADLAALVVRVSELHDVFAERKGIHLRHRLQSDLIAEVDGSRIEQVVANLLSNAIKFSPEGSTVTLALNHHDGGWAEITIADEGPGIPAETRDRLFRPFGMSGARATGGEKSTGLGLAIAKRIVDVHGGEIGVDSTPSEGSRFYVRLPRRSA